MKTINIKASNSAMPLRPRFDDDKYPCYCAEIEKADKRKDWKWRVSCHYFELGVDEECAFKMSRFGDVENDRMWYYILSQEFAVELISIFREGKEPALKEWIKNGCP
jgi:hypothetical protein